MLECCVSSAAPNALLAIEAIWLEHGDRAPDSTRFSLAAAWSAGGTLGGPRRTHLKAAR